MKTPNFESNNRHTQVQADHASVLTQPFSRLFNVQGTLVEHDLPKPPLRQSTMLWPQTTPAASPRSSPYWRVPLLHTCIMLILGCLLCLAAEHGTAQSKTDAGATQGKAFDSLDLESLDLKQTTPAEEAPLQPLDAAAPSLGWREAIRLFRERWSAKSPHSLDHKLAELSEERTRQFRFNPEVTASTSRNLDGPENRQNQIGVGHSFPFGTRLEWTQARAERQAWLGAVGEDSSKVRDTTTTLTLSQDLLRDGPWHGLAADKVAALTRQTADVAARLAHDEALHNMLAAYAQGQESRLSLALADRAARNAEQQDASVRELVSSGYKAKADLLVSTAALARARLALADAKHNYDKARRNLAVSLFANPGDPLPVPGVEAPEETWLNKLTTVSWPEEIPSVANARLAFELATREADLAARQDLPKLAVEARATRLQSDPKIAAAGTTFGSSAQTGRELTRSIGLRFETSLGSNIRRDGARIAALRRESALKELEQSRMAASTLRADANANIALADASLAAAEELAQLADRTLIIERQKYADGRAIILDLRRVQEEADAAHFRVIVARKDAILARIRNARDAGRLSELLP